MRTESAVSGPCDCCCDGECCGWWCCPLTGEVVYVEDCADLEAYPCEESSSSDHLPCNSCTPECGEIELEWTEDGWLPSGDGPGCSCGTPVYPTENGTFPGELVTVCCTNNRCIGVSCCPAPGIPEVLYLTITDTTSVLNNTTVPLVFNSYEPFTDWVADYGALTSPDCASEFHLFRSIFGCFGPPITPEPTFFFETAAGYCGFGGGDILVQNCSPFFMSGTGYINQGFTAPSCSWSISE